MSNKVTENTATTSTIAVLRKTEFLGKTLTVFGTVAFPLFFAKEIADWLEHSDTSKMIASVDADEKCLYTNPNNLRSGGQNAWFLTEYGLYEVLMQSHLKKKQQALPEPTPPTTPIATHTTPIINIVKRTKINDKPLTVFATQEGQLLFWAKQVKGWFGQSSTPNMMTHVKDENKFLLFNPSNIYGGTKAWFLTENGLTDLFYRYGYCGGMDLEGYKSGLREIIRACK